MNEAEHHALLSDGARFTFAKWLDGHFYGWGGAYAADVTGDGYADGVGLGDDYAGVVSTGSAGFGTVLGNYTGWSTVGLLGTKGSFLADVDGDGRADAVMLFEWEVMVARSTGTSFAAPSVWLPGDFANYIAAFLADVDADGQADLIGIGPTSIDVALSTGTAFMPAAAWRQSRFLGGEGTFFADADGDGRADGIRLERDAVWVARSTGQGFEADALWFDSALTGAVASFAADADGDGRADIVAISSAGAKVALSRAGNFLPPMTWYAGQFRAEHNLTVAPEPSAPRGFALATTVGVYRADSRFSIRGVNAPGSPQAVFEFGGPGDIPVTGDWDGDGWTTIGVFRPAYSAGNDSAQAWWYLRNSNADVPAFAFGGPGDLPIAGDWDGNGTTTIGVFRPALSPANSGASAQWFLRNSNSPGAHDIPEFAFGADGDLPVAGDWDADRTVTIGVFRPATREWRLRLSNRGGDPDVTFTFGEPSDLPVVGDWNGNRSTTVGVFRRAGTPLNQTAQARWLLRNSNTPGPANIDFFFGAAGDRPVTGKW